MEIEVSREMWNIRMKNEQLFWTMEKQVGSLNLLGEDQHFKLLQGE